MLAAKVLRLPSSCVPALVVHQRDYLELHPTEINAVPHFHSLRACEDTLSRHWALISFGYYEARLMPQAQGDSKH